MLPWLWMNCEHDMRSDSCICNLLTCKWPTDSMLWNDTDYRRSVTNLDRGSYVGVRWAGKYNITHIQIFPIKKTYILYIPTHYFSIQKEYIVHVHIRHTYNGPTRLCEALQGLCWYWMNMGSVWMAVGACRRSGAYLFFEKQKGWFVYKINSNMLFIYEINGK